MNISVPASWIPGIQAVLILSGAVGFLLDIPLILLLPLFSSVLLIMQEDPRAVEYKPVLTLLALSLAVFLFSLNHIGWALSLAAIVLSIGIMFGLRPFQKILSQKDLWQSKMLKH
jgi:hypothetical protein